MARTPQPTTVPASWTEPDLNRDEEHAPDDRRGLGRRGCPPSPARDAGRRGRRPLIRMSICSHDDLGGVRCPRPRAEARRRSTRRSPRGRGPVVRLSAAARRRGRARVVGHVRSAKRSAGPGDAPASAQRPCAAARTPPGARRAARTCAPGKAGDGRPSSVMRDTPPRRRWVALCHRPGRWPRTLGRSGKHRGQDGCGSTREEVGEQATPRHPLCERAAETGVRLSGCALHLRVHGLGARR